MPDGSVGQLYAARGGLWVCPGRTPVDPNAWTPGVTRPDQTGMSGIPSGTTLTTLSAGDVTLGDTGATGPTGLGVTGSGTFADPFTITHKRITGMVMNKSTKFWHLYQCDLTVNEFGSSSRNSIVKTDYSVVPHAYDMLTIEQSDIHGLQPSWFFDGIIGHGFTTIRCSIYHVTDGGFSGSVSGGPDAYVKDFGSWVHDLVYYQGVDDGGTNANPGGNDTATAQRVDGSHSDCCQIQGGGFYEFHGTFFQANIDQTATAGVTTWSRKNNNTPLVAGDNGHNYYGTTSANTCIIFNQNQGVGAPVHDVILDKCWFSGARLQKLDWASSGYGTIGNFPGFSMTDCIFLDDGGFTTGYGTMTDSGHGLAPVPTWALNTPSGSDLWTRVVTSGNLTDGALTGGVPQPVPWRRGSSSIVGYSS